MAELGRTLITLGGTIFVFGLLLCFGGRLPWFGSLPGDILVRRNNFTLYTPLGTMIVLSILLTVILNLVIRLFR